MRFGYEELLPGQGEAIGAVVDGRDALAVMPTGSVKSAICVAHKKWGEGAAQRYEGEDKMVVLFDEVGYKTLMVALVEEHGLLEPAG